MHDEDIARLARQAHDASLDPDRWGEFLTGFARLVNGAAPTFFWHDPTSHSGGVILYVDWDARMVEEYGRYYAARNVWLRTAARAQLLTPGTVRTTHMSCPRRMLLASEWYADVLRHMHISQALGATILKDETATSNIAVFAGDERRDFGPEEMRVLQALMPDLTTALRVHQKLGLVERRQQELAATLEGIAHGVLLVTRDAFVVHMNRAAERMVADRDGVQLDHRRLRALDADDTSRLHALIGAAGTAGRMPPGSGPLRVARGPGGPPLEITVSPLPAEVPHGHGPCAGPAVAAVYLTQIGRPVLDEAHLVATYGLTDAEAHVAMLMAQGLAVKAVARLRRTRYNTVRTQLQHIYAKTRTGGQRNLIRLVLGLAATRPADES